MNRGIFFVFLVDTLYVSSATAARSPPLLLLQKRPAHGSRPSEAIVLYAVALPAVALASERQFLAHPAPPAKRMNLGRIS